MSTTVTLAGNLAGARELHHTRDDKPFVRCRDPVNRRTQKQGEWVDDEPTAHNVKVFGSAATHAHGNCGADDPIFLECSESWPDKETGEKRIKDVEVVDNRFGEVDVSLKYVSARIDRVPRSAQAG